MDSEKMPKTLSNRILSMEKPFNNKARMTFLNSQRIQCPMMDVSDKENNFLTHNQENCCYITDSDEEGSSIRNDRSGRDDSQDLCQRINNLMKKTRMNSLQRKNHTVNDRKQSLNVSYHKPLTPKEKPIFHQYQEEKDIFINTKHDYILPFKSPNLQCENTYQAELPDQMHIPFKTSSDLSKAMKNPTCDSIYSPHSLCNPRMTESMMSNVNPMSIGGGNQNTFELDQERISIPKDTKKYKLYKNKCKAYVKKINKLQQKNKELEFKVNFYEQKNKELSDLPKAMAIAMKGRKSSVSKNSDKFKTEKKKLLKKCKDLENLNKVYSKEIETLKKKLNSKTHQIKVHQEESEELKIKIKKFNSDIDEYKRTNAVLLEAQMKDVDINNRLQIEKIQKLQNYIKELHSTLGERAQARSNRMPLKERPVNSSARQVPLLPVSIYTNPDDSDESKSQNSKVALVHQVYDKYK
ncbi:unnamed protein product [Moneuplotes crassus]|uniref:Uncharacterized protein n=1 Tax=Euplotes crassus TaxID=5936 RepID=A0AAD1U3L0_EUPCR|nr:unnamed protein product [Moneuplotes crassus]